MKLPENLTARIWFPWDTWSILPYVGWEWNELVGSITVTFLFLEIELSFLDAEAFQGVQKQISERLEAYIKTQEPNEDKTDDNKN